jgi:hypothetical protein
MDYALLQLYIKCRFGSQNGVVLAVAGCTAGTIASHERRVLPLATSCRTDLHPATTSKASTRLSSPGSYASFTDCQASVVAGVAAALLPPGQVQAKLQRKSRIEVGARAIISEGRPK